MKKLLALLLTLTMCLSLAACGKGEEANTGSSRQGEANAAVSGPFSDAAHFAVTINGEEYQFPMTYEDFVARGWEYSADPEVELSPNIRRSNQDFSNENEQWISGAFGNFDTVTRPYSECYLVGFEARYEYFMKRREGAELVLPQGIKLGESTKEDVLAAYGEPSEGSGESSHIAYYYVEEDGSFDWMRVIELAFFDDNEDGVEVLDVVEFSYFVNPNV